MIIKLRQHFQIIIQCPLKIMFTKCVVDAHLVFFMMHVGVCVDVTHGSFQLQAELSDQLSILKFSVIDCCPAITVLQFLQLAGMTKDGLECVRKELALSAVHWDGWHGDESVSD